MDRNPTRILNLDVSDSVTVTAKVDAPRFVDAKLPGLLLAHGANNGLDYPLLARVAAALAEKGVATVVRFNFPYAERGGTSPDPQSVLRSRPTAARARRVGAPWAHVRGGRRRSLAQVRKVVRSRSRGRLRRSRRRVSSLYQSRRLVWSVGRDTRSAPTESPPRSWPRRSGLDRQFGRPIGAHPRDGGPGEHQGKPDERAQGQMVIADHDRRHE